MNERTLRDRVDAAIDLMLDEDPGRRERRLRGGRMKPTTPPRTVADLMTVTGLSKNSVYAAIKVGALPGYYVGKRVVIPGEAFKAFCEGRWEPKPKPLAPIRPLIVTKGRAA